MKFKLLNSPSSLILKSYFRTDCVPFIVKYPKKIKPGRVNNSSVLCAVDLYPTLCSVAGIKTEKNYKGDGQNYAKVLLGKSEAKRKTDLMWGFVPVEPREFGA